MAGRASNLCSQSVAPLHTWLSGICVLAEFISSLWRDLCSAWRHNTIYPDCRSNRLSQTRPLLAGSQVWYPCRTCWFTESCVGVYQISYLLLQFDYFVCPIDYDEVKGGLSMECERSFAFRLHEYSVPWFIHSIGALVSFSLPNSSVKL